MRSLEAGRVHTAVMTHSVSDLAEAIARGENVEALDREGRTPLFYAVRDGDTAIVGELVKHGAKVNARDKNAETPLHFAARAHQPGVAELLLKNGADVHAQDVHGNSPLFVAVFNSRGRGEIIALLQLHGADKTIKNRHGVSSEELARRIANYDVKSLLK